MPVGFLVSNHKFIWQVTFEEFGCYVMVGGIAVMPQHHRVSFPSRRRGDLFHFDDVRSEKTTEDVERQVSLNIENWHPSSSPQPVSNFIKESLGRPMELLTRRSHRSRVSSEQG